MITITDAHRKKSNKKYVVRCFDDGIELDVLIKDLIEFREKAVKDGVHSSHLTACMDSEELMFSYSRSKDDIEISLDMMNDHIAKEYQKDHRRKEYLKLKKEFGDE